MFIEDFGGESLKILMQQKPLSFEEFLKMAIAITDSLADLHAAHIIKLMKILIENVGAQIGYLILDNLGTLRIEAECLSENEKVTFLQSIPVENCQKLAEYIVSYVALTQEKVVLNNATAEGNFTNDPYIKNTQPKSILCAALMNQG